MYLRIYNVFCGCEIWEDNLRSVYRQLFHLFPFVNIFIIFQSFNIVQFISLKTQKVLKQV